MFSKKKFLEKEVVDLDGDTKCSEFNCTSNYKYGIKISRIQELKFLNVPIHRRLFSCNVYCPKHRPSCKDKIYDLIHEEANEEWKNIKLDRQHTEYNKIKESDIFPKFILNGNIVNGPMSERLQLCFENMNLEDYISKVNISVPIMYITDNYIKIIDSDGNILETITKENADYSDFKQSYDFVEYNKKDFFAIKTNDLTGLQVTKAEDLKPYVEEVITMNEFSDLKCPICSVLCPATGNIYNSRHVTGIHRVKLDNKEKLLPYNKHKNNMIMGELNNDLIVKERYDF